MNNSNLILKGFKTKIYPTKEQAEKIIKFCNAARFAYNWALNVEEENHKNGGKFISGNKMATLLTQFKKQEENKWTKEISGRAMKVAVMNAADAYLNFFEGRAKHPKFKSKKRSEMKCATHEGTTIIEKRRIRLEKLGWVKCHKHNIPLGEGVKYCNHKLSYDGIDFWFSVSVYIEPPSNDCDKTEPIGIDLGIKTLATCSNGMNFYRKNLKRIEKRHKKLQHRASRQYEKMIRQCKETKTKFHKMQKSKNLLKLEKKILKLEHKMSNIRLNNIHNMTKQLINLNPEAIVIENLNVSGMMKNRHLSKAISDCSFYEIRRQLEYKCKWNDIKLIIADRWYPSSKICSCCGHKKVKLSLSERTYICEECGLTIDRDYNASLNLKRLAYM